MINKRIKDWTVVIIIFWLQTIFAQHIGEIRLPEIPVYIDASKCRYTSSGSITLPEGYIKRDHNDAFMTIQIDDSKNYTGMTLRNLGPKLGFCFGPPFLIAAIFPYDSTSFGVSYTFGVIAWGMFLSYYVDNGKVLKAMVKDKSGYETFFNTNYTFKVFNKKIKSYKDVQNFRGDVDSYQLNQDVIKAGLIELNPVWNTINTLEFEYNIKIDYSDINVWKNNNIANSGNSKVQGEFETTIQYKERLKKEEYARRAIETEYRQKIEQRKEEYETKRIKLHRDIEKLANEIQFERTLNFNKSVYDADKQLYMFTIPELRLTKKLVVPIKEAPGFDSRAGNLIIKQMVKPSVDGRWIPVYDDVVLADASTGKVIPWEGEVPTYAAAPVTNPPSLSAVVDLSEPSGEGYLDAEELANLKVTLTNSGAGPAKTTRISISQDSGPTLYYDVSATVNAIAPGKSHTERFQITVPENVKSGQVAYTISFLEAQGFEPEPRKFTAEVRAQREPILTLVDFGVVDQDGDGKVTKGESAEITARIQNKGQGVAKSVRVNINPQGNDVFMHPDSKDEFILGNIPSGEARDVTFTVLTNNRVGDVASIELKLDEKRPRFSKTVFVKLEIDKQQKQLATLSFKGTSSDVAIADLATLTVEIEKDIPKGKKKNPDALAVVFGVEDYKNVSPATFAKRDAMYMKEYFEKALGIPDNRIYFKTDDDVGKAEFDKVFSEDGWLDKRVKEGKTDLYIYYAGHGAPDMKKSKAYLIPYDGDPNYASLTGYEMDELYEQLGNLGAKSTTVFLDACFSGANRESEILLAGARPVFMEVEASATRDVTVFSAAGGKEISSVWPEKKHGLFSYYLMKGMRGDADANKDNQITVGELGDYVKENVSDMAGMLDREQTPGLQTLDAGKVLISY
jgi:hypothetical protein